MSNGKENQTITFQLKGIELLDFNLTVFQKPLIEIKEFNFNISVEQKVMFEEKLVYVITSVEILNDTKEIKLVS